MSSLTAISIREGEAALAKLPEQVGKMQALLEAEFAYTSLADIESGFKQLLASSAGSATENANVGALLSTVRNEVTQTMSILLALKRWIRVQVPKIEDGNNFGVSVQLEVAKGIDELTTPVASSLGEMPGYFESRASAWDKIGSKKSKESKTSSSASKDTGGKDGDSSKTSESTSTEEKTSESSFAPDSANYLIALDVKWFVSLHHTLLRARDSLVLAADMIEKNMEKLLRPKGTNTQGGGMYSF
ncbi:unnamed protein product [Ectocarpus sp. CCAP 1310/34]|nr:unnamed protein product [Ectocarpus sp. CCAP 1310/34]